MHTKLIAKPQLNSKGDKAIVCFENKLPAEINNDEILMAHKAIEQKKSHIKFTYPDRTNWLLFINESKKSAEELRKIGHLLFNEAYENKTTSLSIDGSALDKEEFLNLIEGFTLSSYQFLKYFSQEEQKKKAQTINGINLHHENIDISDIEYLKNTNRAVFWARDMVNEPVNHMNATTLATQIQEKGKEAGFSVEVLDKKQIESLRMGGLLAVNKGSIDPPTFTIATWNPENAVNTKPYIIVGKGVMYDTGGLSLKPTAGSMDLMKSDMAGAAAIAASLYSIAQNKLPVWIIALIPATDNRPDGNAYAPGDIIKMYNGLNVEVLNTDAEGRMILADALSYADKFNPELVIDMATLTGSAVMAIGSQASVIMGNAKEENFERLKNAGEKVHERVVQFPFWDDYKESIKSKIADIKNLGGREAGSITAGKFLEHFTESPYIHIDIAGPAFLTAPNNYQGLGGTGYGVRLLTQFFKSIAEKA